MKTAASQGEPGLFLASHWQFNDLLESGYEFLGCTRKDSVECATPQRLRDRLKLVLMMRDLIDFVFEKIWEGSIDGRLEWKHICDRDGAIEGGIALR